MARSARIDFAVTPKFADFPLYYYDSTSFWTESFVQIAGNLGNPGAVGNPNRSAAPHEIYLQITGFNRLSACPIRGKAGQRPLTCQPLPRNLHFPGVCTFLASGRSGRVRKKINPHIPVDSIELMYMG